MIEERMNTIITILVTALILLVIFCCKTFENHYSIEGEVYKTNGYTTTFEDITGHTWMWENEDSQSFEVGQKVTLYFNDNNTDVRQDDILKKIKLK